LGLNLQVKLLFILSGRLIFSEMINIYDVLVSDDLLESYFVCDLEQCKGACCVEGDLGAPLEKKELRHVKESFGVIKSYLSEEGIQQIKKQGHYVKDFEGDYSTPTISGRECAYSVYDEKRILKCGFELAWQDGRSKFRKPVLTVNEALVVVGELSWEELCRKGLLES
jgi:hypothetical protein